MTAQEINLVAKGHERQWLLPNGGVVYVPLEAPAPGLTILVHGVNDIGEAYPYQEQGICKGLSNRLDRGRGKAVEYQGLQPTNYELPPLKNGVDFTADDIHPDPDKVYFAPAKESPNSPVIGFYWGFRERTIWKDFSEKHGQNVDRFNNRIDKRYAKNGGAFANATTNIPDIFRAQGFSYASWLLRRADPKEATHPLMDAPPRGYMVLAAQRLAALIRIIRKKSPNEPINIVAHSQGCFITTLAHAILAKEGKGIKADTIIYNNWPYSIDEPAAEQFQTGQEQQTSAARAATLEAIIKDYITSAPATQPPLSALGSAGNGVVGKRWAHDQNKERDNRGKCYLYLSPDDNTVGLLNVQGIGYWGVYKSDVLKRLGERFYQRVFTFNHAPGRNQDAPAVGSPAHHLNLKFAFFGAQKGGFTLNRPCVVNAEELPAPFYPHMGPPQLDINPLDAVIAITNTYGVKGQEGVRPGETPEQAQARWMNQTDTNSYHSSIVSNSRHAELATAYDLCIGTSGILTGPDLTWMRLLRAVADWRTNWFGVPDEEGKNQNPSYPPPGLYLVDLLQSSEVDATDRDIVKGNWAYYYDDPAKSEGTGGVLPAFTTACTVESLAPYVVSETISHREQQRRQQHGAELDTPEGQPVLVAVNLSDDTLGEQHA